MRKRMEKWNIEEKRKGGGILERRERGNKKRKRFGVGKREGGGKNARMSWDERGGDEGSEGKKFGSNGERLWVREESGCNERRKTRRKWKEGSEERMRLRDEMMSRENIKDRSWEERERGFHFPARHMSLWFIYSARVYWREIHIRSLLSFWRKCSAFHSHLFILFCEWNREIDMSVLSLVSNGGHLFRAWQCTVICIYHLISTGIGPIGQEYRAYGSTALALTLRAAWHWSRVA